MAFFKQGLIIESAQVGTKYLLIKGTIKNLSSSVITPKNIKTKLVINEGTELNCTISLIDGNASSLNKIQPMNSAIIIIDTPVSEDMISSIQKTAWELGFNGRFAYSGSSDLSLYKYYYSVTTT